MMNVHTHACMYASLEIAAEKGSVLLAAEHRHLMLQYLEPTFRAYRVMVIEWVCIIFYCSDFALLFFFPITVYC